MARCGSLDISRRANDIGCGLTVPAMKNTFAAMAILALLILHQDFWFWRDRTLVFGILPVGLAYHAAYTLLAAQLMWLLGKYAWPAHLEEEAGSKS